ncbi:hypothetical protein DM01DRAFT_1332696 [Hesseltinella vesiculosa]|uniref:Beta-sandwich domain of Sec23/24 n=1 Tax=Hesseltinella vesiculosa TaxID=101127 RepID=A0A1X2GSV9_9FUNG|nr:hypothetical protein DM01DRAFT_1332696 [Hesseltinella vesiculosa]
MNNESRRPPPMTHPSYQQPPYQHQPFQPPRPPVSPQPPVHPPGQHGPPQYSQPGPRQLGQPLAHPSMQQRLSPQPGPFPNQHQPLPQQRSPLLPAGQPRPPQPQQRPMMPPASSGALPPPPGHPLPVAPQPAPQVATNPGPPPVTGHPASLVAPMQSMSLRAPSPQHTQQPTPQQLPPQHAFPPQQQQQQPPQSAQPPAVPQPLQPPNPKHGRSKRVYAVDPQVTNASTRPEAGGPTPPWPHGLNPPQQAAPPLSRSPVMSSIQGNKQPAMNIPGSPQQPLPADMRPPQQPRPRIDPDQMPAPVQVREQDQLAFENQFFGTMERDRVPLATTDYIGLDQGNSNPRYLRATTDKLPVSKDLADTSKLPLALVVQPLAKRRSDEVALQVVNHGDEGPVRCSRCRAYISPWCSFIQGGSRFVCSICSHANDVPNWYFSNTDMSGRRVDIDQRPELRYGSVEFDVPQDYHSSRAPAPLSYVFAIDVSAQALQSGMVKAACEAIKSTLFSATSDPKLAPENRVGILTFDKSVHFYNLHPSLPQALMLVVSDIEDMFIPIQDGFLVDTHASKDIILELLDSIPTMFQGSARPESAFLAAVQGGKQALALTGGHLHVFQSTMPNHGPHALKPRDDKTLYNTEKEKSLMVPQDEAYKDLAKECVKDGVCVNTWLFPAQYIDVATLAVLPELTGGDVRFYPNFNFTADATIVQHQLDHDVHRELGYDGVLRIRCSDGLQVIDHYGNCHMSTYTDMELAGIDEDKAMAAVLKHDSKLDPNRNVAFQCALLYTTKAGQRRVRVHNLNLTATSDIAEVFRHGDVDTTISVLLRKAIFDLQHKNRKEVHQKLTDLCVEILTAYRVNCASSTSPGQLILPEAFKLLPVYVHGAIRSKALRGVGNDMNTDARSAGMRLFNGLDVKELAWTIYPRLFELHTMSKECGEMGVNGYIELPTMIRTSYGRLNTSGVYLLDSGSDVYIWLGSKVDGKVLASLFGVDRLDQVDPNMTTMPVLHSELSHQVHAIMDKLKSQRSRYLQLHVIRQELDPLEFTFSTCMTEDRNAEVQTYVDFMCVLHRKIQEEMKKLQH